MFLFLYYLLWTVNYSQIIPLIKPRIVPITKIAEKGLNPEIESVVHSINEKKNLFLVKMDTSDHTIAATLYKTSKQVFVFFF